jgi:hypothetical protein
MVGMPVDRLIGHPLYHLYLLRLWVLGAPARRPLALMFSVSVMLKPLHSNGSIHLGTKSLAVSDEQLLLQKAREAMVEIVSLLRFSVHVGPAY